MNDLVHPAVRVSRPAELRGLRERVPLLSLLRRDVALNGPSWLPLALVLGAVSAVAYADHAVVSISLVYLYILPLAVVAIFLRKTVSHSLIVVCVLFPDYCPISRLSARPQDARGRRHQNGCANGKEAES